MIDNPHYLYRMTILRAICLLAPVMGSEITCSKLLPVVVNASKDRYVYSIDHVYQIGKIGWSGEMPVCWPYSVLFPLQSTQH